MAEITEPEIQMSKLSLGFSSTFVSKNYDGKKLASIIELMTKTYGKKLLPGIPDAWYVKDNISPERFTTAFEENAVVVFPGSSPPGGPTSKRTFACLTVIDGKYEMLDLKDVPKEAPVFIIGFRN